MRNVLLIARREYLEQIKSRAFRLSTVGLPAALALVLGISYFSTLGLGANKHLAIAAGDQALANGIRARLLSGKRSKAIVDVVAPARPEDRAILVEEVRNRAIDGFLWIETPAGKAPTATYISQSAGDFMTSARLKSDLNDSLVSEHLTGAGMMQADADTLLKGVALDTFQVRKDGQLIKSNAQMSFWKGYMMAILLTMTTMIYGLNVARSIVQEKTSRVFEVMLATVKPSDMLAGKLIGAGTVGLTQIAIWLVAGAAIFISPIAAAALTGDLVIHFSWSECVLFPVYFRSRLSAFQLAVCRPGRHLRNGAGTPDVHAAGRRADLDQLFDDHPDHERFEFLLVGRGLALSAHRAHRHVSAHGLANAARLAVCGLHWPHDGEHLGHALVLFAPLPRGHPHVRQARHAA